MQCTWLGSDKHTFVRHWFDSNRVPTRKVMIFSSPKTGDRPSTHFTIQCGRNQRNPYPKLVVELHSVPATYVIFIVTLLPLDRSNVMQDVILTSDSVQSWRVYGAAKLVY